MIVGASLLLYCLTHPPIITKPQSRKCPYLRLRETVCLCQRSIFFTRRLVDLFGKHPSCAFIDRRQLTRLSFEGPHQECLIMKKEGRQTTRPWRCCCFPAASHPVSKEGPPKSAILVIGYLHSSLTS